MHPRNPYQARLPFEESRILASLPPAARQTCLELLGLLMRSVALGPTPPKEPRDEREDPPPAP